MGVELFQSIEFTVHAHLALLLLCESCEIEVVSTCTSIGGFPLFFRFFLFDFEKGKQTRPAMQQRRHYRAWLPCRFVVACVRGSGLALIKKNLTLQTDSDKRARTSFRHLIISTTLHRQTNFVGLNLRRVLGHTCCITNDDSVTWVLPTVHMSPSSVGVGAKKDALRGRGIC